MRNDGSESGLQKSHPDFLQVPTSLLTTIEYKIDHISKTKNHMKKNSMYKYPVQNIAHLLRCLNFFWVC